MLVSVKILKGGECTVEVSSSATIAAIKKQVAQQMQIPVHRQRLVFKGKTLLDSETICDCNINEGNKLFLFVSDDPKPSDRNHFWELLQQFLERHFTVEDANKVLEEFKKIFNERISSMSLDDIERLAIMNLEQEGSSVEKNSS